MDTHRPVPSSLAVTIVLADDHRIVRQGIRRLIEADPGMSVVAEAGDGLDALDLVREHKPDVLIVDIGMPGLNGLEVARRVKAEDVRTRVVVLTMHVSEDRAVEALRNGADAYVAKDADISGLVKGIREVMAGRQYVSPNVCKDGIDSLLAKARQGTPEDPYDTLTEREREVLHLAAAGCVRSQIGERLTISPRTVEVHRLNAMRKLGLHSQTDLVCYAIRRGIISVDDHTGANRAHNSAHHS